eukprot:6475451-Amphidinium_carterae.2
MARRANLQQSEATLVLTGGCAACALAGGFCSRGGAGGTSLRLAEGAWTASRRNHLIQTGSGSCFKVRSWKAIKKASGPSLSSTSLKSLGEVGKVPISYASNSADGLDGYSFFAMFAWFRMASTISRTCTCSIFNPPWVQDGGLADFVEY